MQSLDEEKLAEGFKSVDEAELLVTQGQYAKAIFLFQQAIDFFDKCGVDNEERRRVIDRISDRQAEVSHMYENMPSNPPMNTSDPLVGSSDPLAGSSDVVMSNASMKNELWNSKKSLPPKPRVDPLLEEEGLKILDLANKSVKQGNGAGAIPQFQTAIEKLLQAGWAEEYVLHIREEIQRLSGAPGNPVQQEPVVGTFVSHGANFSEAVMTPTGFRPSQEKNMHDILSFQGNPVDGPSNANPDSVMTSYVPGSGSSYKVNQFSPDEVFVSHKPSFSTDRLDHPKEGEHPKLTELPKLKKNF